MIEMKKIAFLGASIVAGARSSLKYPDQIQEKLCDEEGLACRSINLGVGGNTTVHALARIHDVTQIKPDLTVISIGTNDAAIDVWKDVTEPRVSLDDYAHNIESIINELDAVGSKICLMAPPPMWMTDALRKIYGKPPYTEKGFNFMLKQYAEKLESIAESHGFPFLSLFELFLAETDGENEKLVDFMDDGMHPNQKGNDLTLRHLFPVVQEILVSKESTDF